MDSYFSFLEQAFCKVINACAEDQSLNILKTLENQSFYLSRVHQIFAEIYIAEREEKILSLFQELKVLKDNPKMNNSHKRVQLVQEQSNSLKVGGTSQSILCKELENVRRNYEEEKKQNLKQLNQLSQVYEQKLKISSKENQSLTKALQDYQEKFRIIEEKLNNFSLATKKNQEQSLQNEEIRKVYEERSRELSESYSEIEQKYVKIGELNKKLRTQNSLLEDKIRQIQKLQKLDKNKISMYEKQVRKIAQDIRINPTQIIHEQLEAVKDNSSIHNLLQSLKIKQEEYIQCCKTKSRLQEKLQQTEKQFVQYKISTQKQIFQLKQNFQNSLVRKSKQIEDLRQSRDDIKKKYQLQNQTENMPEKKYQQRIKQLNQQISARNSRISCLQQTNKQLLGQYSQIIENSQQEKKIYDMEKLKLENKLQEAKKLEKQLMNQINIKNIEESGLETSYKQAIKQKCELIEELQGQNYDIKEQNKQLKLKIERYQQKLSNEEIENEDANSKNDKIMGILQQQEQKNKLECLSIEINKLQLSIKEYKRQIEQKGQTIQDDNKIKQKLETQIIELKALLSNNKKQESKNLNVVKELQENLTKQRCKLSKIEEKHRKQISNIYQKNQANVNRLVKQLQKHYSSMLEQHTALKANINQQQTLSASIPTSVAKVRSLESQIYQLKAQLHESQTNNTKVKEQLSNSMDKLQKCTDSQELMKKQLAEKQKESLQSIQQKTQLIKHYEDKIVAYKDNFRQFKYQFCSQVLQQMKNFRADIINIKEQIYKSLQMDLSEIPKNLKLNHKMIKSSNKIVLDISQQILTKFMQFHQKSTTKHRNQISYLREEIVIKLQNEKKQLVDRGDKKVRQKTIEMMSIMAEKQFQLNNMKQQLKQMSKKYHELKDIQQKNMTKIDILEHSCKEYKDIIKTMEEKVNQSIKQRCFFENQLQSTQIALEQQNHKILQLQNQHRQQLNKCRQKYIEENQRMFDRYEQEFGKMLKMNEKSKEYLMQRVIPTRCEQNKVEKLKNEILKQRSKIQQMQKNDYMSTRKDHLNPTRK